MFNNFVTIKFHNFKQNKNIEPKRSIIEPNYLLPISQQEAQFILKKIVFEFY